MPAMRAMGRSHARKKVSSHEVRSMKPVNFTPLSCNSFTSAVSSIPGRRVAAMRSGFWSFSAFSTATISASRIRTSSTWPPRTCCRRSLIGTAFGAVRFAITPWMKRSAAKARRR